MADSTIKGEGSRIRMTLDLSKRLNEVAERIANEKQTTKAEVLRFALEFLSAAENAKQAGMHVGAWSERNEDGTRVEREFVGL